MDNKKKNPLQDTEYRFPATKRNGRRTSVGLFEQRKRKKSQNIIIFIDPRVRHNTKRIARFNKSSILSVCC